MWICRTVGTVVATIKQESLEAQKLLMVCRTTADGEATGDTFVAIDAIGVGEDELVLVALGSAARECSPTRGAPVDAAIVGIIDLTARNGVVSFTKSDDFPAR